MRHVPVIIVGSGPVGMTLAMSLAQLHVSWLPVNTEPTSCWFSKGSTHKARTMEHSRRFGISRELRRLGLPGDHPTDLGFFTTLNGWELARISMASEREKLARVANVMSLTRGANAFRSAFAVWEGADILRAVPRPPSYDNE